MTCDTLIRIYSVVALLLCILNCLLYFVLAYLNTCGLNPKGKGVKTELVSNFQFLSLTNITAFLRL